MRLADEVAALSQRLRNSPLSGAGASNPRARADLVDLCALVKARAEAGGGQRLALESLGGALSELLVVIDSATAKAGNATRAQAPVERSGEDMHKLLRRAALALGVVAQTIALPAFAQDATSPTYIGLTPQDVGVMDRARPEYDAKGIPMGGFRLFPTMDVTANYDDNVLRQTSGQSDWYFEETPELRLQSQWGRHFFEVYGGIDNYNYSKFSRLNLTDWTTGLDGRYDISRAAFVSAAAYYGEYHESLSSPDTVGFQESPNRYNKGHAEVTGKYQPNRLGVGVGASVDHYDWKSTPLIGGGDLFNTDRNEDEYQGYVKAFYDFSPGYSGFVKALYDDRAFAHYFDRSGLHRSSHGYHIDAGVDMQISHLLTGEVFLGYLDQSYKKNVPIPLSSVSGLDYGVGLDWYASQVLTVHLNGGRVLSDTTITGVSATDNKEIKLSADYEFRRNIIVQGYVGYTNSKFVGTSRTDDYPTAGISAKYMMNRYMSLDAAYNYSKRSSNFSGAEFSDNLVTVGLSLHI